MQENELIENKELRNKMVNQIDVLEKVKKLLLLPGTELMKLDQVAEYFDVEINTIKSLYYDHKDELDSDGVALMSKNDFLKFLKETLEKCTSTKGTSTLSLKDGSSFKIPNRGLKVFPKRAVLRIGMLLRDSDIAREVRTQLLNIEEKATVAVKLEDLDEQKRLALNCLEAYASGNNSSIMKANSEYIAYQNRYIEELKPQAEAYNKLLNSDGTLSMNDVAKEVGMGEFTLFSFLRRNKVLFYNKEKINIPYQRFMDEGFFIVKESVCPDGKYRPVTRVTKRGLDYIYKLLKKSGYENEVVA